VIENSSLEPPLPQNKITKHKVDFLINIQSFRSIDLEHQWAAANTVLAPEKRFTGKNIHARILLIDWWEILGTQEFVGIVVDRLSLLIVEAGLKSRH
jgi:hypothetical protein